MKPKNGKVAIVVSLMMNSFGGGQYSLCTPSPPLYDKVFHGSHSKIMWVTFNAILAKKYV